MIPSPLAILEGATVAEQLTEAQVIVLAHIGEAPRQISRMSEPFRQRAIDLGMMEPPLVDVDGDWAFVTVAGSMRIHNCFAAGRQALDQNGGGPDV